MASNSISFNGPGLDRTLLSGQAIARVKRALARAAAFNPEDAPADTTGVTLSMEAAADPALTRIYGAVAGGTALTSTTLDRVARFSGGRATIDTNLRYIFPVASIAPAVNGQLASLLPATPSYQAWGYEVEFSVPDAVKVQLRMSGFTTHGIRVLENGHYLNKAPLPFQANGSQNYPTLVFADRRPRTIRIEGMQNDELVHVAVAPAASIAKSEGPQDRVIALCTGDSYSEGTGSTFPGLLAWTKALGRRLGWSDTRQVAVGQTGYLSNANNLRSTVRQQVANWFIVNNDLVGTDVDVVCIAAGYNDYTQPPAAVQAEAYLTWQAIRAACPNAIIFVFGSHAGMRGPDAQTLAVDAAIQTAFAQWADSRAFFVPIASDPAPWMFGTGTTVVPNGTGNTDFTSTNDGHPADFGHAVYALRAATALSAIISRM